MDKFYSKRALIYKTSFSLMLAPLYALLSMTVKIEDAFLYLIVSILPIGCLYTVPFWPSLVTVKKYRVPKIGKYVILDILACLLPAFCGILLFDIITALVNGTSFADGFSTLIFSVIFSLVSFVFWLLYLLLSKIK